mmetsp:Transcript_66340/g.181950  ORF Transcript_66340/g.181950 Transcript_66340/m.181950 type:complete len:180 (+) Transcript_66340:35-574(+)
MKRRLVDEEDGGDDSFKSDASTFRKESGDHRGASPLGGGAKRSVLAAAFREKERVCPDCAEVLDLRPQPLFTALARPCSCIKNLGAPEQRKIPRTAAVHYMYRAPKTPPEWESSESECESRDGSGEVGRRQLWAPQMPRRRVDLQNVINQLALLNSAQAERSRHAAMGQSASVGGAPVD